ncbi:nucleotide exchange factor GrpE [Actinosynnema sp. NPDC059797]
MRELLGDVRRWSARRLIRLAAALDPEPEHRHKNSKADMAADPPVLPKPATAPPTPEPEPDTPLTDAALDDGDGVSAARAVLAVADRLTNRELARRLFDATCRIPGVVPVRPAPGDPFDPLLHEWSQTRSTDHEADVEHVAELLTPGFQGRTSGLIRPALVAVYDITED